MSISRRAALRGAGALLGLPLLEAMLGVHGELLADGTERPRRLLTWFWGNGVPLGSFEPTTTGAGFSPSPCLAPLAPVLDHVNLCTGFWNRCRTFLPHHAGLSVFSGGGLVVVDGASLFSSHMDRPTIDQLVADRIGGQTPFPSLHVGCDRRASDVDGGTTLAAISHRGDRRAVLPELDPQRLFDRLFRTHPGSTSVVDLVRDDLHRLEPSISGSDAHLIEAHLNSLREYERRLDALARTSCFAPSRPALRNEPAPQPPLTEVADLFDELLAVAFSCDLTRVATYLFHRGASRMHFHMLGQSDIEHHHDNSHHRQPGWESRYTDVVAYCMERLAHLATVLLSRTDPTGASLLDSTIIMASTDCGPGFSHSLKRQPIILIGQGGGHLRYPGVHVRAAASRDLAAAQPEADGSTSSIGLSVLRAFDPEARSFGDLARAPFTGTGTEEHDEPSGTTSPLTSILA